MYEKDWALHTQYARAVRQVPPVATLAIEPRMPDQWVCCLANSFRGFVALAVATDGDINVEEIETGHADREKNMVDFAKGALQLLLTTMKGVGQKKL